jgi:glycosyltransferase involved in cell wall biosynthesis
MELNGAKILISGMSLEEKHTRGLKTYSKNLLNAYKELGADISVLISRYSPKALINTDISTLFQEINTWEHLKSVSSLSIKTMVGKASNCDLVRIPKDLNITEDFSSLTDAGIYVSPGCYKIAKHLRYLGLKLTIAPNPKVDIWHATYCTPIKIKGTVKLTTIHDITSIRAKNNSKDKVALRVRDAIKDSKLIICVSEHTKKDLVEFYDINPDKFFVNYQPVLLSNEVIQKDTILNKLISYDLKYGQFILFFGQSANKNLKRLIEAYLCLSADIPLVIVGKKDINWKSEFPQFYTELTKAEIQKRVRIIDYISESDKYILYKGAMFLAFPSLYEGFGLPPIEAMSLGVPVITSSVSCMPEVCGDAALYVDPYDVEDIANKITMMINDKELRQRLIKAGYERAKIFSMDNFINGLKTAYSKI